MEETDDHTVTIDAPASRDTRFVSEAVTQGIARWGIVHHGVRLATHTELGNYGLGSSAAATVASLKALAVLFQKEVTERELFELAHRVVVAVQGRGSGFDVAASVCGGTLFFAEAGRIIEPLSVKELPLVVGFTGVKADTPTLMEHVAWKKEKNPQKVERIFAAIARLVDEAKIRMLEGDWERVGRLMDFNQEYLRDLGVSSEKLESLISAAKHAGALGAKLSGAGVGDCMIALAPGSPSERLGRSSREQIAKAIEAAGGYVVDVRANAPGVRVETTDDQQEVFIVVDTDDNVLGYRSRYDCHHDKSLIHRTVGALVFDGKGRVLLQKRSSTKDMGAGLWGISCAGHVRKGQDYEEALHRELVEEIGIDVPVAFVAKFIVESEDETEMCVLYRGVSSGPFRPNPEEVEQLEFFLPRELTFKIATKEIVLTKWAEVSLHKAGVLQ